MIEEGDEIALYDWALGRWVGIAAWRISKIDYAQDVAELDLQPGVWFSLKRYRVTRTKEELAQDALTRP